MVKGQSYWRSKKSLPLMYHEFGGTPPFKFDETKFPIELLLKPPVRLESNVRQFRLAYLTGSVTKIPYVRLAVDLRTII